jgi:hypothetical protein
MMILDAAYFDVNFVTPVAVKSRPFNLISSKSSWNVCIIFMLSAYHSSISRRPMPRACSCSDMAQSLLLSGPSLPGIFYPHERHMDRSRISVSQSANDRLELGALAISGVVREVDGDWNWLDA